MSGKNEFPFHLPSEQLKQEYIIAGDVPGNVLISSRFFVSGSAEGKILSGDSQGEIP